MAAFNWINFEATCPSCHQLSSIRCQTHIASDYDGDEDDRFHNREYRLGYKMAWRSSDHKNFLEWREEWGGDCASLPLHQAVEACTAECRSCKSELCAVILFDNLRSIEVQQLVLGKDWPKGYSS